MFLPGSYFCSKINWFFHNLFSNMKSKLLFCVWKIPYKEQASTCVNSLFLRSTKWDQKSSTLNVSIQSHSISVADWVGKSWSHRQNETKILRGNKTSFTTFYKTNTRMVFCCLTLTFVWIYLLSFQHINLKWI